MNRKQRKLVHKWIGLVCTFIGAVVLEQLLQTHPGLVEGILFLAMIVALRFEGPAVRPTESSSDRIARIVNANPWIRAWLLICALGASALAVLAIFHDFDLGAHLGFGGLLGAVLLVGAPILIMGERERFLRYGASDDEA